MKTHAAIALLAIGSTLAACTAAPPAAPRTAPPMAGTAEGSCPDSTLSAAARERAGAGCVVPTTQGMPAIVACEDGPQVAYSGRARGTLGDPNARRVEPGGRGDQSCN
jgi:hypothetical protein